MLSCFCGVAGCKSRVIAVMRVGVHQAFVVKISREHAQAALPVRVGSQSHGCKMPVLSVGLLHCYPVPGAVGKSSGLKTHRVVFHVGKRTKWCFTNVNPISINIELRTGCCLL